MVLRQSRHHQFLLLIVRMPDSGIDAFPEVGLRHAIYFTPHSWISPRVSAVARRVPSALNASP